MSDDIGGADQYVQVPIVYLGRRALAKQGIIAESYVLKDVYDDLVSSNREPAQLMFAVEKASSVFQVKGAGKSRQPAIVGGIYNMTCKLDIQRITSARPQDWQWIGRVFDNAHIMSWQASDKQAYVVAESEKRLAKLKAEPPFEAEMKHLIAAYRITPHTDRLAFELMVVQALRRGS